MTQTVYLSLGSNLGDREQNIINAVRKLSALEGFESIAFSPLYVSDAVDMDENAPRFLNMVIKGDYTYRPLELLDSIERIEKDMGRVGKGEYQPRRIDIDILLFGDEKIKTDRLAVPHPRMTKRRFVLEPLVQIAPELVHPVTGKRFDSYLARVADDEVMIYKENVNVHV